MSAAATTLNAAARDAARDRRPSMARLTAVELRKMVDTRAGFWLPFAIAAIVLITVIISALAGATSGHTTRHIFRNSIQPASFLLPVLGILLVCGEWTQNTTLTTFTLVPSRARVIGAKILASVVMSAIALIVCLLLSELAGLTLADAPGGAGGVSLAVIGQTLFALAAAMITGIGFGAAILLSAPAIVAYLLLPTVWDALASSIHALHTPYRWLDTANTFTPLAEHAASATEWARAGTSLALWMLVPLAIGWWRISRGDVA